WIIRAAVFSLLNRTELDEHFQRQAHCRKILCGFIPSIEVLVLGTVRNLNSAAGVPIEALSINNTESLAPKDVNGFFAVNMFPRVPADRNLCFQDTTTHSGETKLVRDHELDLGILPRPNPRNIPIMGYHRRATKLFLNALACSQPFIVKSPHSSSSIVKVQNSGSMADQFDTNIRVKFFLKDFFQLTNCEQFRCLVKIVHEVVSLFVQQLDDSESTWNLRLPTDMRVNVDCHRPLGVVHRDSYLYCLLIATSPIVLNPGPVSL